MASSTEENTAFDREPAPLSCHIQLKTIGPRSRQVKANLASIGRLAKEPKPSFIYVLTVDETKPPIRARIIPVRGAFMAKILRDQRKAYVEGKPRNSDFTFNPAEWGVKIDLKQESLKAFLEEHIGDDISAYMAAKKFEYGNLGYEEGRILVRGQLLFVDRAELRAAYVTGDHVAVEIQSAVDRRFGLETPANEVPVGPSVARFDTSGARPCRMEVITDPLVAPLVFQGVWHILPEGIAEPGYAEAVFQADLFSIFSTVKIEDIGKEETRVGMTLKIDGAHVLKARLTPAQWHQYYLFMERSADKSVRIRILADGAGPLGAELKIDHPADSVGFYRRMGKLSEIVEHACSVAGAPDVMLGINDLYHQGNAILTLGALFKDRTAGSANFGSEFMDFLKGGEILPVLYFVTIPLGNFSLVYCLQIEFESHLAETEVTWTSRKILLREVAVVPASDGHIVNSATVEFLDRMRVDTAIDSYFIAELPSSSDD